MAGLPVRRRQPYDTPDALRRSRYTSREVSFGEADAMKTASAGELQRDGDQIGGEERQMRATAQHIGSTSRERNVA
ncbi:hypothetical protein PEC106664_40620 [Pectobacterium carotovorum subsp. carotovorum]|nr:hypothetical protein [Pectobacterium carotovorum subsp. carotovorum]PVY74626.1 hypothetical protein C7330_3935 [Pectobacterium versatile]GKV83288.1 hypothetical protein PEC106664_40620 [Pectobacterium carotovorum subsp. carotovorum]